MKEYQVNNIGNEMVQVIGPCLKMNYSYPDLVLKLYLSNKITPQQEREICFENDDYKAFEKLKSLMDLDFLKSIA